MSIDVKRNIEAAIKSFAVDNIKSASEKLLNTLGYSSNKKANIDLGALKKRAAAKNLSDVSYVQLDEWKSAELIFQLTGDEMQQQESLFKSNEFDRDEPASYLFFAVDLQGNSYSRNQLSQFTRAINKLFPMHVFVIFKYANSITLSLIDRRAHKKIGDRDVLEKVTHVYNVSIIKPHAAHIQILYTFSYDALKIEAPKKRIENFKDLQNGWRKVISTDVLNKQFYLDYSKLSISLIHAISKQVKNKMVAHQGVLNLLNRIMFIYFVEKKEWIMNDSNFIYHFWNHYKKVR